MKTKGESEAEEMIPPEEASGKDFEEYAMEGEILVLRRALSAQIEAHDQEKKKRQYLSYKVSCEQ